MMKWRQKVECMQEHACFYIIIVVRLGNHEKHWYDTRHVNTSTVPLVVIHYTLRF